MCCGYNVSCQSNMPNLTSKKQTSQHRCEVRRTIFWSFFPPSHSEDPHTPCKQTSNCCLYKFIQIIWTSVRFKLTWPFLPNLTYTWWGGQMLSLEKALLVPLASYISSLYPTCWEKWWGHICSLWLDVSHFWSFIGLCISFWLVFITMRIRRATNTFASIRFCNPHLMRKLSLRCHFRYKGRLGKVT